MGEQKDDDQKNAQTDSFMAIAPNAQPDRQGGNGNQAADGEYSQPQVEREQQDDDDHHYPVIKDQHRSQKGRYAFAAGEFQLPGPDMAADHHDPGQQDPGLAQSPGFGQISGRHSFAAVKDEGQQKAGFAEAAADIGRSQTVFAGLQRLVSGE